MRPAGRWDVPITGGNVSLYNETDGRAIYPTPVLGVVGVLEDASRVLGRAFRSADATILLLGAGQPTLGGSEYLKAVCGQVAGTPPPLSLDAERALQRLIVDLAHEGLLQSAHDCSDGGLAVTLAECSFDTGGIGAELSMSLDAARVGRADVTEATVLFGEAPSRVLISVAGGAVESVRARASAAGVPTQAIGRTGGGRIRIDHDGRRMLDVAVADIEVVWARGLERFFVDSAA